MKDLLQKALDLAYKNCSEKAKLRRNIKYASIDIDTVKPLELRKFMADNDIPDDAKFSINQDSDCAKLEWVISDKPYSDDECNSWIKSVFSIYADHFIYTILCDAGYTALLHGSIASEIYDLYMSKDFKSIMDFYSKEYSK